MIDLIEGRLDVKLNHPVISPAPFSGDSNCLFRRPARSISIRIRMKDRVEYRLDDALDHGLRNAVSYSRDGSFIMHLPLDALRMRCGFGLSFVPIPEASGGLFH